MRSTTTILLAAISIGMTAMGPRHLQGAVNQNKNDTWPDGTPIAAWFNDTTKIGIEKLGRPYVVTDYGVQTDSTLLQTKALQAVIDQAAETGGGVVVIPEGTFLSGALFFRPGTHLHMCKGA